MRSRGIVPNRGPGPVRRRPSQHRATYVLEGPLRFVDRSGSCAALRVDDGNAAGRRFVGRTVTLDLRGARVAAADRDGDGAVSAADLLTGDRVSVVVRLARGLAEPPPTLPVSRISAREMSEAP